MNQVRTLEIRIGPSFHTSTGISSNPVALPFCLLLVAFISSSDVKLPVLISSSSYSVGWSSVLVCLLIGQPSKSLK